MPGAWYAYNMTIAIYIHIISFSPFWFSLTFQYYGKNLIYDAEEKNGLFAATSATRVIIFAVRPFALFGRVKGKPAAISSHNRVYTVPCSVFLLPYYVSAGFLFLVFICYLFFFTLSFVLLTLQRYKHSLFCASILQNIFVSLTFVCCFVCLFTYFKHKIGKMCNNRCKFLCLV